MVGPLPPCTASGRSPRFQPLNDTPSLSGYNFLQAEFQVANGSGTGPDFGSGNAYFTLGLNTDDQGIPDGFLISIQAYGSSFTQRYAFGFSSGSVTVVTPEPPGWILGLTGGLLLLAGYFWFERRRAFASLS